jgi:uncharacterized membrane protein YtjA (UPF0391 family)
MIRASIVFFVIGLIAVFLGMNGVGGLSIEIGKLLLLVFCALAVVSLLVGLATGRRSSLP